MAERRSVRGFTGLQQAFDEVRFGASRTLNLRASFPTAADAARRLDVWLREQQAVNAGDVLIVTGRGNNSEGGVSVVREASIRTFYELQRKNVIESFTEHTPGSFVVTIAPLRAMLDARQKRKEPAPLPPVSSPPTLATLSDDTRAALRVLAERALDALGTRVREPFMEGEMLRLFGSLAARIGDGPDREGRLRAAIAAAMDEYD